MSGRITRSLVKKAPQEGPRRSLRIVALAQSSKEKNSSPASKLPHGAGAKSKKLVAKRQLQSGRRRKLSFSALQDLDRETINEPLPNALKHVLSTSK